MELRIAHARRIISAKLCSTIWQPFSADVLLQHPQSDVIRSFLEQISSALKLQSKRKAGAWQALTTEGLANMTAATAAATSTSRVDTFITDVLAGLDPLIEKSKLKDLRADLHRIATDAAGLWRDVQRDTVRLRVEAALDPAARNEWGLAFEEGRTALVGLADHADIKSHPTDQTAVDTTGDRSGSSGKKGKSKKKGSVLCLFPRILRDVGGAAGEEVVYCGCGLAEDSALLQRGQLEQKDLERAVEEAKQQVYRNQMTVAGGSHSRGNSVSQVPPSPITPTALQ
jgi:hypothetical protein